MENSNQLTYEKNLQEREMDGWQSLSRHRGREPAAPRTIQRVVIGEEFLFQAMKLVTVVLVTVVLVIVIVALMSAINEDND